MENKAANDVVVFWRGMHERDLSAVVSIAEQVHPDYPESPEVFAERLRLFADGCRVAVDGDGGVRGYAITHPSLLGQPPALNSLLHALPTQADCLYLHDIALTDAVRQYGLGGKLVGLIKRHALTIGIDHAALVAVNDSAAYWRRRGFSDYLKTDTALLNKLGSYDRDAQYLVLNIVDTV